MPYKITNISNTPISINSPSTMEDDLYLAPGQTGLLKYEPVLGSLRDKVVVEHFSDPGSGVISKDDIGLGKVENLSPLELPVSVAAQNALNSQRVSIDLDISSLRDETNDMFNDLNTQVSNRISETDFINGSVGAALEGDFARVGGFVGIVENKGTPQERIRIHGSADIAKASGVTFQKGDPVYWNIASRSVSDIGDYFVGVAGAASGASSVQVRLLDTTASAVVDARGIAQSSSRGLDAITILSSGGDDTLAIQSALDTGKCVVLASSKYKVTNLQIPHVAAWDSADQGTLRVPSLIAPYGAFIEAIAGGDSDYLISFKRWVSRDSGAYYPSSPVCIEGVSFDAKGLKRDVFVAASWKSTYRNCSFTGGTRHGVYEPVGGKDGTLFLGSRALATYESNRVFGNGGVGFLIETGSHVISDYRLVGNLLYDNAGAGSANGTANLDLQQFTGFRISENHSWHTGSPDASVSTLVRLGLGTHTAFGPNIWEGINGKTYCMSIAGGNGPITMSGQTFMLGYGPIAVFSSGTDVIRVTASRFVGGACGLGHGANDASKILYSANNVFDADPPYSFTGGAGHAGRIISSSDTAGGKTYSGVQRGALTKTSDQVLTVAQLPSAASSAGTRLVVSDSTAASFGSVLVGGGSVSCPVYSDGTVWRCG